MKQEIKEVVIFARVSSTGDRQDYQRQVNDLTDYATRNGMKVKRVFAEKVSGGKRNEGTGGVDEHDCLRERTQG